MAQKQLAAAGLAPKAEEIFKGLWTSLFYAPQSPPKSVLVCSSNRREGATTVACGLALAGAGRDAGEPEASDELSSGRRVVLVDLNLRNPAVGEQLNLANGTGISNVLVGEKELGDALQRIRGRQLDVLTAGSQYGRVLEVLRTDRVRAVLEELQRRYEYVIVDTAPVNQYPDARVLAEVIGCVALVARYRQTHHEALLQAKKQLELGGGKVAGVVLSMRTYPIPRFVYRRV